MNESSALTRYAKAAVVHKVIDITPEPVASSAQAAGPEWVKNLLKNRKGLGPAGAALIAGAVVAMLAIPHGKRAGATAAPMADEPAVAVVTAPKPPVTKPPVPKPELVELNLPTAVQQGLIECQWRGDGKDRLLLDARNVSGEHLQLRLAAGQLLASEDSTVVVVRAETLDFAPKGEKHEEMATVATSSANRLGGAEYHLSAGTQPELEQLFAYVAAHPGTSAGAVQTAALILTENLPLSVFAKFKELSAGVEQESENFKADTVDILLALTMIKELGVDRPLAVLIDPQLEVEGMIDPNAHGLAVRYYGITDKWAYWKHQLLEGDPSTRHYALYGIARYYPDVALAMLPKWARQEAGSPVYRMSAVEALAQTGRAEAIPILRQLESEFGGTSELGRAAHAGANYLDAQFARTAPAPVKRQAAGVLASVGELER